MKTSRRVAAIGISVVALSSMVAGGVVAGSRSSDEDALRPARSAADRGIEAKVGSLLRRMTLQEKLNQIQLLSDGQVAGEEGTKQARNGVGGVFSLTNPVEINRLQHEAVENSRLHIPILFAFDTIH